MVCKKRKYIFILFFLSVILNFFYPICNFQCVALENAEKKACWISYLDIQEYLKDKTEDDFRASISEIYDRIIMNGMNTVIMHVRPMCDAMYPSQLFPWSTYISDDRVAPGYDPLSIMIQEAEKKGLFFEAWLNPYRVSLGNTTTMSFKETEHYEKYKDSILEYQNSSGEVCMALDPSKESARKIIVDGVREIVANYNVDAIHFDDYFYVSGMLDDLSVDKKKEYVNILIKEVYTAIKEIDNECMFGISPAGNLENARSQGADIDKWLSVDGYIDYIMPQIYWSNSYVTSDGIEKLYEVRCSQWMDINKIDLPIYVGLALYRIGEESEVDLGWGESQDNLANQYEIAKSMGYDGFALFRYSWLTYDESKTELNNLKYRCAYMGNNLPFIKDSYVSYVTYVSDFGWQSVKIDGILSGTTKQGKGMRAISISLGDRTECEAISYRIMTENGWSSWYINGALCQVKADETILDVDISLQGNGADDYILSYRIYHENYGWSSWIYDEKENAENNLSQVEAIQIKIKKNL